MNTKRATVYLDPELHRGLRIKAAQSERTVSELVNEAIRLSLTEDLLDLSAFEQRAKEPDLPFEKVLKNLRASGKI
jgi:hypothetical protein